MIDLTQIILGVITIIGGIVARYLIPWIKAKLDDRQYNAFIALVRVGVYAAEQLYGAGNGTDKYKYVLGLLRENGYEVDTESVRAMIEATVKEMKIELK